MNADREHRLELSLRNCLALARRMESKDPDARLEANDVKVAEAAVMSAYAEARRHLPPGALAKAMHRAAVLLLTDEISDDDPWRSLLGHMGAIRKFIDAARTLEDGAAESNSTWPSQALESDADAAEHALTFIADLLGLPSEDK